MSKADGVSQPQRSQNPSRGPGVVPQRSGVASYDSDQFPVLIRLPDLTTSPKSAVTPPAQATQLSVESPDVDDGGPELQVPGADHAAATKRPRNRRTAADRDTVPRRYTVRGILASLPSQALVMLVLAAVTALVYLLVQGVDPAVDNQQVPVNADVAQTSPGESETDPEEPKLWPVSNNNETLNASPGSPSVATAQNTPAETTPPSVLAPDFDTPEPAVSADHAYTERTTDRTAASDGPVLTWQSEPPTDAASVETVAPVQGWPPELGPAGDSTLSPQSSTPYDRAAYSSSSSSPGPDSQTDLATIHRTRRRKCNVGRHDRSFSTASGL